MLESRNTGNWTWPDNVWRNANTPSPFISCNIDPSLQPTYTDHLPIISVIDLTYIPSRRIEWFNYKNVNWKSYKEALEDNLTEVMMILSNPIETMCTIENATDLLFDTINKTTREVVPLIKITPHTKCWWTKELTLLRKSRNRASAEHYRWHRLPEHPCHLNYKKESVMFARVIEKAKADHWQEWINHATGEDIWTIHRYMKVNPMDYRCQRVPALKRPDRTTATTNNQKAEQLANTFFPLERPLRQHEHQFVKINPPTATLSRFPSFTTERVANTLTKVNPHKAPGPSGISNTILKHCAHTLAPHLATIYTAICRFKHYPNKF